LNAVKCHRKKVNEVSALENGYSWLYILFLMGYFTVLPVCRLYSSEYLDEELQSLNIITRRPIAMYQLYKQARVQEPLLGNTSVNTLFPRQRGNKQSWKRHFPCCLCPWLYDGTRRSVVGVDRKILCGGGVEYLHRSPASRRRRRKGNPVPGGITEPPFSGGGGYKYEELALQVGGVSNLRQ
jgi:hypothetical protein